MPQMSTRRIVAALEQPSDELRPRFARADEDTKTAFTPDVVTKKEEEARPKATPATGSNEQLLATIRALQTEPKGKAPERKPVDLNGISPAFLLLGAASYGACSVLGWQFTINTAALFDAHPVADDTFYVVARLSTVARYVVVAMGALGTTVTAIAATGQAALCVQVSDGIRKGELDPKKPREDPYGGRKLGQLEKMLRLMLGDKAAGLGIEDR